MSQKVIIIGAGLAGSLLAVYLAKNDYEVEIYEARDDFLKEKTVVGKSINLALSLRGMKALEEVGILNELLEISISMPGRMIHSISGEEKFQPYGKSEDDYINSVSRGKLNQILLETAINSDKVNVKFNAECTGIDPKNGEITIKGEKGIERKKGQAIIATDGVGSAIRYSMQKFGRFNYSQEFLRHGYKELTIPPGQNQKHQLEKKALHIWPRKEFMLIALPNPDGSFTATLFFAIDGELSFNSLNSEKKIRAFFLEYFPDVLSLVPCIVEEFNENPVGLLGTIRCEPWNYLDYALLIGDASHAIVPFYGQGMNAAFEDCRLLVEMIKKYRGNWAKIFPLFSKTRKPDADAIADLALDNFIEMRDRVADERILFKRQIELSLSRKYPEEIISQYSLVTFTHTPYSIAKKKGKILAQVVDKMSAGLNEVEDFNFKAAREVIIKKYQQGGLIWP